MSLKFGLLGVLAEEPLHGYEIKARFEAMLSHTWEVNIGQVYSTLQRLERDALVEAVGERGDRGKQAYRLTDAGRLALEQWLAEPEASSQQLHDELFVKLALMRRLANGNIVELITRQKGVYLQRIHDLTQMERRARAEQRPDLLLLIKGAVIHTEADINWLDVCLEEIDSLAPHGAKPQEDTHP